ncbi:MAG: single-stranded-DNA-specific exonuclease RecJ [Candidatus Saccharibacteria bacterium]
MSLFDRILSARGIDENSKAVFLHPDYSYLHDPFLLKDMEKAVNRLVIARKKQEHITIYGDYDIDGLTATTLLVSAFKAFGFKYVDVYIPNRFTEGYGLTVEAINKISKNGAKLIVTVDCGSNSKKEVEHAKKLNIDVIISDHHSISGVLPSAVAVINPNRDDDRYPFSDLAGVGVAFKLVQALQSYIDGIPLGHEKWFLDLVSLGTVCDVVPLVDENRIFVYFGLKVLSKTRRPGLKALMAISAVDSTNLDTRAIGFRLGPRMNAAGRLETAQYALDMLIVDDSLVALEKAEYLNELNKSRRFEQDKIIKQAIIKAEKYKDDPVLVVSDSDWSHGIVGIVAARLLETYKKPVFILQEIGDESKGSARSFGEFSAIDAVNECKDIIIKGGGHKFAAGILLKTKNIDEFRKMVNKYYKKLGLVDQSKMLLPKADAIAELGELNEELVGLISKLEPFGIGNPQPIIETRDLEVVEIKKMGADGQHIKLNLRDKGGNFMQFISFNSDKSFYVNLGEIISIWYTVDINEWQGRRSIEGQILHLECLKIQLH